MVKLLAFLVILETLFAFLVIESPSTKFPIRLSNLTVAIFSISSSSFFSSLLFSFFVIVEDRFISACGFVSKNEIEVTWLESLLLLSCFFIKRLLLSFSNLTSSFLFVLLFTSFESFCPKLIESPNAKLISLTFSTSITVFELAFITLPFIGWFILNTIEFSLVLFDVLFLPEISIFDEFVLNSNSFLLLLFPVISILEEPVDNSSFLSLLLSILRVLLELIALELVLFLFSPLIFISLLLMLKALLLEFFWLLWVKFISLLLEILISLFLVLLFVIDNPLWFEAVNSTFLSLLLFLFSRSSSSLSTSLTPYKSIDIFSNLDFWEFVFALLSLSFNLNVWTFFFMEKPTPLALLNFLSFIPAAFSLLNLLILIWLFIAIEGLNISLFCTSLVKSSIFFCIFLFSSSNTTFDSFILFNWSFKSTFFWFISYIFCSFWLLSLVKVWFILSISIIYLINFSFSISFSIFFFLAIFSPSSNPDLFIIFISFIWSSYDIVFFSSFLSSFLSFFFIFLSFSGALSALFTISFNNLS